MRRQLKKRPAPRKPGQGVAPDPMAAHFKSERPPAHEDKVIELAEYAARLKSEKKQTPDEEP